MAVLLFLCSLSQTLYGSNNFVGRVIYLQLPKSFLHNLPLLMQLICLYCTNAAPFSEPRSSVMLLWHLANCMTELS